MGESVQFYAGITDPKWFEFLAQLQPNEVNFWRPRSQNRFSAIKPGAFFLFKLKGEPYFVGGGIFAHHSFVSLPFAWQSFEQKNGARDYKSFERLILPHRSLEMRDRPLGCTIVVQPFFWPRALWIPAPEEWAPGLQAGKVYDTGKENGAALWAEVQIRLQGSVLGSVAESGEPTQPRYGEPRLVKPRLGQGAFRVEVTDAYMRRCAITGERTLPALEAGHIRPYSESGPHEINNGLLLRSDLHNLFDLGYLTISFDYKVQVSRRIREEFENGRHYYELQGKALEVIPRQEAARPAREFLEWHHGIFKS
jgi:putative restriction endonuclease